MNEFSIIQNNSIGALAIYSFTKEYYQAKNEEDGILLPYMMPVLPLVFNHQFCSRIVDVKRITQTRFFTTLSDFRDIPVGLQERMIEMSDQTLSSISMALSLNLVRLNNENGQFYPVKYQRNLPKLEYGHNQQIIHSAKVIGRWFAAFTIEEICISLNITF